LAGRTPALAVRAFVDSLQHLASCITHTPLIPTGYDPAVRPHALTFAGPRELALPGSAPWHLSLAVQWEIVRASRDRGPWDVRITSYAYELLYPADQRIVAYHWHPGTGSRVQWPHLHVPQHTVPVDLSHRHLLAPPVTFGIVLRFAIEELGVELIRQDWAAVLAGSEPDILTP
jgi:hypothetical protein